MGKYKGFISARQHSITDVTFSEPNTYQNNRPSQGTVSPEIELYKVLENGSLFVIALQLNDINLKL